MISVYIICGLSLLTSVLFMFISNKEKSPKSILSKLFASLLFVIAGVVALTYTSNINSAIFIVLGLIFGMIGDIILDLKLVYSKHNDIYTNFGMLSFGIGHIMYFISLLVIVSSYNILLPLLVAIGIGIIFSLAVGFGGKLLDLNFGKFKIQSMMYSFILSFMTVFSIILCFAFSNLILLAIGITLILISDLFLTQMYFGNKQNSKIHNVLVHTIYYIGQILLALSILFI